MKLKSPKIKDVIKFAEEWVDHPELDLGDQPKKRAKKHRRGIRKKNVDR